MAELTANSLKRPAARLWLEVLTIAGIAAYLAMSYLPGRANHDWVHLWTAGRVVVQGSAGDLYNADVHRQILERSFKGQVPPECWPERNQKYGVFFYPPPMALFYAALAWLPRYPASIVHAVLCTLLAVVCGRMLRQLTQQRLSAWTGVFIIVAYPPFFYNFVLGQNAMLLLVVVLGAWTLIGKQREFWAGVVLGLLVCKINWLVALGWIPLIHGRWRLLTGLGCGALGVLIATALILGLEPFYRYLELFPTVAGMHHEPGYVLRLKHSSLGLMRKWLGINPTADIVGWLSAGGVILVSWIVTRGRFEPGSEQFARSSACCLTAAMWVNPHLNHYDLMLTTCAVAVVIADWNQLHARSRRAAVLLLLMVYAATPWDNLWSWYAVVPVPGLTLLALWMWSVYRLGHPGRIIKCIPGLAT